MVRNQQDEQVAPGCGDDPAWGGSSCPCRFSSTADWEPM